MSSTAPPRNPGKSKALWVKEWKGGLKRIFLCDGTTWPHPESCASSDAVDEAEQRVLANAYRTLVTHPWGTEVSIQKLRELRRAYRRHK